MDLRGSRAYVAAHESELDTIVCDVNVDMPGAPRKFVRFLHPELEPLLKAVIAELPGYELDPEPAVVSEAGGGSDQAPFVERGVAAVALWGEIGPGVKNYHTAGDTYDIVDRRGTTAAAAVLAVLVRHLADAPQRPAMRQLPTTAPAE